MTGDNSPGLGGQHPHSGDESCLGGDDWQLRCDWCKSRVLETTLYFGSQSGSVYGLCPTCLDKVESLNRIQRKHRGGLSITITGIDRVYQALHNSTLVFPFPTARDSNYANVVSAAQAFRIGLAHAGQFARELHTLGRENSRAARAIDRLVETGMMRPSRREDHDNR